MKRGNTTEEEDKSQNFSRPSSAKSTDDQCNGSTHRKSLSHISKDSRKFNLSIYFFLFLKILVCDVI